eukprot:TRINITY_DN11907_c0_g1_i1.p1 TRINITY_DN11907_c0_g1~~TRINITY_DN11907_c0_g1_i1.p1  ORF type:complete len:454 (+),score=97.25 TRINITY_DN11907_c0_g1_i1:99-1364(+)
MPPPHGSDPARYYVYAAGTEGPYINGVPVHAAGSSPLVSWSDSGCLRTALTAAGTVLCRMAANGPLQAEELPWPAAAEVACGNGFAAALRADRRAICSWADWRVVTIGGRGLGREVDPALQDMCRPTELAGLPATDPVALFGVGSEAVLAVTEGQQAFGWGNSYHLGQESQYITQPTVLPAFCGRRFRRLACGAGFSVAECASDPSDGVGGRVLAWGPAGPGSGQGCALRELPIADCKLPLRCLACAADFAAAADAVGAVYVWRVSTGPERVELPAGKRAESVACGATPGTEGVVVALTDNGELYDCSDPANCVDIRSIYTQLPPDLAPHGGGMQEYVVCLPRESAVLAVGGARLGDLEQSLADAGLTAEATVELLRRPPASQCPPLPRCLAVPRTRGAAAGLRPGASPGAGRARLHRARR